eukprot:Polyplicarium_translucidae@DN1473_c0_g1_i1.p1
MWGKIVSSFSTALDFNAATLSGCIDIIAVEQENGSLKSTPFHVRFGKAKLLRSREKEVAITVNGVECPVRMTLGAAGEAYFVEEVDLGSPSPASQSQEYDAVEKSREEWRAFEPSDAEAEPRDALPEEDDGEEDSRSLSDAFSDRRSRVQMSMCGHLLLGYPEDAQHDEDVFNANMVDWDLMNKDPMNWYHPSLVVRFDEKPHYFPGKLGLPLLASWVAFGKPPSISAVEMLMASTVTAELPKDKAALFRGDASRLRNEVATAASMVDERGLGESEEVLLEVNARRGKRTLRPSSAQLGSLGLVEGSNRIQFTVHSTLQGAQTVSGTIYLWPSNAKIVVSDVDGTITRSDVLGQLMPIVGKDWSHAGVAQLFGLVRKHGYHLLYLTARAIGQADTTRDYLFGLTQGEGKLPDGPLILSPDRLFPSFRREVIDRKPYIFKIAALKDMRHLFPSNYNPFHSGFGNRDTDHRAYVHIGIPESKVFIIDPNGTVHHINQTYAKTYDSMSDMVDHMFPPLLGIPRGEYPEDEQVREAKLLSRRKGFNMLSPALALEEPAPLLTRWCGAPLPKPAGECGADAPIDSPPDGTIRRTWLCH